MELNKRLSLKKKFKNIESTAILVALALEIIIFWSLSPQFLTSRNLLTILQYCALTGLVALPVTMLMISGNFDISLGSQVALTSCITAMICQGTGTGWGTILLAILASLAVGMVCGLLNAFFIMKVNLPPFIATMAMMQALRGVAYLLTNGRSIMVTSATFGVLGRGKFLGIPNTIFILLLFVVVFGFLLKYTVFGRRSYTIGGNASAARLSGINVRINVSVLYMLTGAMCGLVGMLSASQLGAALPSSNAEFAFDVISAVILGGVAMTGGKGSITGTIVGVILLAVLDNGLIMLDVSSHWQLVCSGAVLLLAVSIDSLKQLRANRVK